MWNIHFESIVSSFLEFAFLKKKLQGVNRAL